MQTTVFTDLTTRQQAAVVGYNLRRARRANKLTMAELAAILRATVRDGGIGLSYIGEIERGLKNPTLEVVLQLAQALDIEPASLFELPPEPVLPDLPVGHRLATAPVAPAEEDNAAAA